MDRLNLDAGPDAGAPRARPRRAVEEALDRLLRAHATMSEARAPESPYGLLRPARDEEMPWIEAAFARRGVPLAEGLRAVFRRTLGIGNPVSRVPVLAVPFGRAVLPDEGWGSPVVGLDAFADALGAGEADPPVLCLGHAFPLGLSVSRGGLWSVGPHGRDDAPEPADFRLPFEAAFPLLADQAVLVWANDLAGDAVRPRDLDLSRGARAEAMPPAVREAHAHLLAPRSLGPRLWGEVEPMADAGAARRAGPPLPIAVVGLPYGEAPEVAAAIAPGAVLRLRPVDDNPHDGQAVEVWLDGARVGFVARGQAPLCRALPGGAAAWSLRVAGRSDRVLYAVPERPRAGADAPRDLFG